MDFKFSDPHYDCMPRDLAEKALWQCSPSEFKLLYFIARKTIGFRKFKDRISLSQFEQGTHLTRKTVLKSLKSLQGDNWILIELLCPRCGTEIDKLPCYQCDHQEPPDKRYSLVLTRELVDFFHYLWVGSRNFPLGKG